MAPSRMLTALAGAALTHALAHGPPVSESYGHRSYGAPTATVTVTVTSAATCYSSPPAYPESSGGGGISYNGGAPTATIDAGVLYGTTTSLPAATASVNKFLGVPFAVSPPERFSPPQEPAPFKAPINATAWSPACIQQFVYPLASYEFARLVFNNPPPAESEDCLYLNVYAPSTPAPSDGRAVLFWIYGGSLEFGNAGQPYYDGSAFASYEDVIVVSTNYRTNVFGFPNSPELPLTGQNLGFLDQRAALDWVQRNIHVFGGSPEKVTIFGESAGAFSIDALLTSFPAGSSPPFRAAIAESGQISYRGAPNTNSTPSWEKLSADLGCPGSFSSNLSCVRAANASTIRTIIDQQSLIFNSVPDNVTLVSDPAARRLAGNIAPIPVVGGTNGQEGRVFEVGQNDTNAFLTAFFGNETALISAIEAAYPLGVGDLRTPYDQISQIFTEYYFQCPQAKWANDTASVGIPAWRYYFNASFVNTQAYPNLGVYHSSEIPMVWDTYLPVNTTTQEAALSQFMQGAWARFAKNPKGGPGWNAVGTGAPGSVLVGAYDYMVGGYYSGASGTALNGSWDLAVLGNAGEAMSSGVTVIPQELVDYRCGLFEAVYAAINGVA